MPTIVRQSGFEIRVNVRGEHHPPHVHVRKSGADIRVKLGTLDDGPVLWDVKGRLPNSTLSVLSSWCGSIRKCCWKRGRDSMAISRKSAFKAPTEIEIEAAIRRGDDALRTEPHARSIQFDPASRRFTMAMTNGTTVSFEVAALPELQGATDVQLAGASLMGQGDTLAWIDLDMHISVEGLIIDLFGGPLWQKALRAELSRRLARSGSEARTQASRENGRKGGRPKKRPA
jgi:hypothetical protein